MRGVSVDDAAIQLAYASKVVIVPGYGLAAAQAQHAVQELAALLESRGVEVTYAIHPVAGRMPGHMNVLLAEANVSYERMNDLDQANAGLRPNRRRARRRRERHHQPGGAPAGNGDLRHADPRRRPGRAP